MLLHSAHSDSQLSGDLLVREAMHLAQQIDLTTLRRQLRNCFTVQAEQLTRARLVFRRGLGLIELRIAQIIQVVRDLARLAAELGERDVLGDAEQEGLGLFDGAIALDGIRAEEGFLCDVVDVGRAPAGSAR